MNLGFHNIAPGSLEVNILHTIKVVSCQKITLGSDCERTYKWFVDAKLSCHPLTFFKVAFFFHIFFSLKAA